MPTRQHGPAYGLLLPADLTAASRRRFLAGGAFLLGFAWVGQNKAWAKGEEPSLRAIRPGNADSGAAFDGFAPGGFIRIGKDNIVFIIPNTEMGQGIYTGEAMLIAEELEVGLDQITVMAAPPNEKLYAQPILKSQATGGSSSIRGAWEPLRQAGAAARTMLIGAAAQRWSVSAQECYAERGVVHCRSNGRSLPYGALIAAATKQPVPQKVPLKTPDQFKLLGRPMRRIDTPAKVNGSAQFGIDVRIEGMKIAALEICPVQGGRLAALDDSAARALPGVVDILRIGDAVAVVGDHYWAAKKGLEALKIVWNPGPGASNSSAAMWATMKQASDTGKPVVGRTVGDVDRAMKDAKSMLDAAYELPMLAHATMEPINTTVHVRPDGCEIWVGTQVPTAAQAAAAQTLGLPVEKVAIHNQLIGGGFGRRLAVDSITQAVLFAKQVSYPIKVIWSREQDTRHDHFRPAYYDRIACGLGPDGLPIAWTHRTTGASVLGDYLPTGFPEGQLDTDAVEGAVETPYDLPVVRVDWVRTKSPVKVNWWRGVGPTHNVFVVESFLDEVAHSVGRDPIEYRRALLKKNPRALGALNLVAEKSGWGSPLPPRVGRGVSLHDSFGSYLALVVEVEVTLAGTIKLRRLTAAVDCGININPNSVIAQVEGGTIFGLSAALYNGITLTGGAVDQGNFNDYRQIRIDEIPSFDTHIVPSRESPGGLGECGTVSAAPALGNAIFAATGQRLRSLPFQPALLVEKGSEKQVIAGMVGLGAVALAAAATTSKNDTEQAA